MKMVWFKDYHSSFSECTSIRVCLAYVALMAARGGGVTSLYEANGDVPLDGPAFSRVE